MRLDTICRNATPECGDMDRLQAIIGDPNRLGAVTKVIAGVAVYSVLTSDRTGVCMRRCDEPNRLCMRPCYDAPEDAGPRETWPFRIAPPRP